MRTVLGQQKTTVAHISMLQDLCVLAISFVLWHGDNVDSQKPFRAKIRVEGVALSRQERECQRGFDLKSFQVSDLVVQSLSHTHRVYFQQGDQENTSSRCEYCISKSVCVFHSKYRKQAKLFGFVSDSAQLVECRSPRFSLCIQISAVAFSVTMDTLSLPKLQSFVQRDLRRKKINKSLPDHSRLLDSWNLSYWQHLFDDAEVK